MWRPQRDSIQSGLSVSRSFNLHPCKTNKVLNRAKCSGIVWLCQRATRRMTLREASAFAKVSVSTLRRAIARNRLTAYRVNNGSHLRVNSEDVDRWLRQAPTQWNSTWAKTREASSPAPNRATPLSGAATRLRNGILHPWRIIVGTATAAKLSTMTHPDRTR